jgi:hypothetical protein
MFCPVGTSRSEIRAAWTLAFAAAAARIVCLWLWPAKAYSVDLFDWQNIAAAILFGANPYVISHVLNWPPMWMEILYILGQLCDRYDWQLVNCVRILLIAGDIVMVLSVWKLLGLLGARDRAFAPALWGLCLNPFLILLTIQQGNFDVIPTVLILWFLGSLIKFRRNGEPIDWLIAAAWLGLGGFAKTFPLVLAPLLFGEARRLNLKTRLLGAALLVGPAGLSLAPLYVLNPVQISTEVIFYRGTQGNAGASGILQILGGIPAVVRYNPFFTTIVIAAMLLITLRLWWRRLPNDGDLILLAALILIGLFEFGTGYCPQYWMWPAPLLCIAYVQRDRAFRIILIVTAIVVIITQILIFAYDADLGSFALFISANEFDKKMVIILTTGRNVLGLISLPLTAMTLLLWLAGVKALATRERAAP